jgi:hypothetical protein
VTINPEGLPTVVMRVKFEKGPRFCVICGLIGHVQEECGSGVHSPGKVCFGKWMLVDTAWNRAQLRPNDVPLRQRRASMGRGETGIGRGGVMGGGRGAGRGGGSGRGRGEEGRGRVMGRG